MPVLPKRKSLHHDLPDWVPEGSLFFITVNCAKRGSNQIANETAATALLESLRKRKEVQQWYPHLFLIMPDHIHGLFTFASDRKIERTIEDWKRWHSRQHGILWQRLFFEHRLRNDEQTREKADYIIQNPVRAGLVLKAEDWPYIWNSDTLDISPTQTKSPG